MGTTVQFAEAIIATELILVYLLFFQEGLEFRCDSIANLRGICCAANIARPDVLVDDDLDGFIDVFRDLGTAERVLEHHADGENGCYGVADALSSNVGRRAWAELANVRNAAG